MRKLRLKELNRLSTEDFKSSVKTPIVLVLDNIRSAHNVGSAFRTADAFALESLYLCGITAKPPHREILKTAIGASHSMDWQYFQDPKEALQELKKKGYHLIAVEQTEKSLALQNLQIDPGQKLALIFGNEVAGISDELLPMVDQALEVPQFGTKHSLNVSVCIGLVVWDIFKQMRFA